MAMLLLFYQFFSSRYKYRAYLSLTIKNFDRMSLGAGWGSESEQLIYIFRLMYYWLIVITCSCYTNQTTGSFDLVADHMILLNLHNLADDLTKDVKHKVDCDALRDGDLEIWLRHDMCRNGRGNRNKAMTNLHCLFAAAVNRIRSYIPKCILVRFDTQGNKTVYYLSLLCEL